MFSRKMLLLLVMFSMNSALSSSDIFTNQEVKVVFSMLRYLNIGNCILSSDESIRRLSNVMRNFTKNSILTGSMSPGVLNDFIKNSKAPPTKTGIIIKTNNSQMYKNVFVENPKRIFWYKWIVLCDNELDSSIRIPFNGLFLQIKKQKHNRYKIVEKYHLKNSSTFVNDFGFWSRRRGLKVTRLTFYERRKNMKGVELVRTDAENNIPCDKYAIEHQLRIVWVDLSHRLNFSLKVVNDSLNNVTSDDVIPDGSTCIWGIVGLDFDKDWIFSNFDIYVRILTKFRSSNEVGWRAYVRPFKTEIWTVVCLWLVLSTTMIIVVQGCTKEAIYHNIYTAFFCLCNSDPMTTHPPNKPVGLRIKISYLMLLTVPAVIVPAYSAYILATLSVALPMEPFNSLQSFITDGSFKLTTVTNTFMIRFLKNAEDSDLKYIYTHFFVGAENTAPTYDDFFQLLCDDNKMAGLFIDSKSFHSMFKCKMFVMKSELTTITSGFLLQKNSPLRKLLNEKFYQFREYGLLYRQQSVHQGVPPIFIKNFKGETEKISSLTMSQTAAIFLLIPLGIVSSLVVLALEVVIHRRQIKVSRLNMFNLPRSVLCLITAAFIGVNDCGHSQ